MCFDYIYISASNSTDEFKAKADYVCTGKNDELMIQKALDECIKANKNLYFLNGKYCIDALYDFGDGGPLTAICVGSAHREIKIIGQNNEYPCQNIGNGVVLYVSKNALENTQMDNADIIRSVWTCQGIQNGSSLRIENLTVILANSQHPVRCIDLRRTDRVEMKNVNLLSYGDAISGDASVGLGTAPPIPAKGCIGLTMTDGSNYEYSYYTNVFALGFDEGIQVGGEHVVCISCGAAIGNYGFTFGNYPISCGSNHPMTLINCLDERNVNLPYFGKWCGDGDGKGGRIIGNQEVELINFNMERIAAHTPGGKLGDLMKEEVPGSWCGSIRFTAQPAWCCINSEDFKIWESDGSGSKIKTVNSCHKTVCTSAERLSYYPMLGQEIFDTDLNKKLICINPDEKIWVDCMGNKA